VEVYTVENKKTLNFFKNGGNMTSIKMIERNLYMPKRDNTWTIAKYKRFLSENRGAGNFDTYKPWLTIQDFPSKGRVSRLKGWKSHRIHHFFSDIQTRCFYLFEWNDDIVDIREHFPLLDLVEVLKDNKDLKQDFFNLQDPPYILTTTFLLTLKDNTVVARAIKSSTDLGKKSVLERLEIERRYWKAKNINFAVITEKEISMVLVKNIEWIHQSLDTYEERGLSVEALKVYSHTLIDKINNSKCSIRKITNDIDNEYDIDKGTGLFIFKYLLATKKITVEMNEPIEIAKSNPNFMIDWRK
jgi:TnsA endonuclease C terminal./TnsA endonuclease N terminal.